MVEPMTRPKTFRESSTFGGEQRQYTRQRLYALETGDYDASMHAVTADDDEDNDPYAEAQYTRNEETSDEIDQFRQDIVGDTFRALAERRVLDDTAVQAPHLAVERAARIRRAAILAAMGNATNAQHSYFSRDYAACVPPKYKREFLASVEVASILGVLLPALYAHDQTRAHTLETVWRRALADRGALFKRADTRRLEGHMRAHATYESEQHAHYCRETDTTTLRLLTFQIQTNAAATAIDDGSELAGKRDADAGYYLRLVFHLVEEAVGGEVVGGNNVVCFRSFVFSRFMPSSV
jgi:hypothetical protein